MRAAALGALLAALALPVAALAQDIDFPALTGRVVDAASLLDPATEAALDARLAAHESASSDQVVVATVPSLDGRDVADYANRLGRAWGIGTAENDNGVLLVVAPNERAVRIEVGYGLEGALPDALAGRIVRREILPAFRSGDYAGGIEAGTDAILRAIEGEYVAPPDDGRRGEERVRRRVRRPRAARVHRVRRAPRSSCAVAPPDVSCTARSRPGSPGCSRR